MLEVLNRLHAELLEATESWTWGGGDFGPYLLLRFHAKSPIFRTGAMGRNRPAHSCPACLLSRLASCENAVTEGPSLNS